MSKLYKGIDVSKWQGKINWAKVKQSDIDFAILRCGYTGYGKGKKQAIDKTFERNYKGAKAQSMPVGAYFFSRATTEAEGRKEAQFVHTLLKGKQLEYPIYIDVEDKHYQKKASVSAVTNATKAFCEYLESKGYYVGIYASKSWFKTKLDLKSLAPQDKWVAQWNNKCTLNETFGMWQYTNKGRVKGIFGRVDTNISYKDYASIMKTNGLNGFAKTSTAVKKDEFVKVKAVKVGSQVKVKKGAKTYSGKPIAPFVFNNIYRVDELKNNRAVLDLKGICTPVNICDLTVI